MVDKDIIQKSFLASGLTTNLNGSDDCNIHAVKELDIGDYLENERHLNPAMDIEDDVSSSDESICSD